MSRIDQALAGIRSSAGSGDQMRLANEMNESVPYRAAREAVDPRMLRYAEGVLETLSLRGVQQPRVLEIYAGGGALSATVAGRLATCRVMAWEPSPILAGQLAALVRAAPRVRQLEGSTLYMALLGEEEADIIVFALSAPLFFEQPTLSALTVAGRHLAPGGAFVPGRGEHQFRLTSVAVTGVLERGGAAKVRPSLVEGSAVTPWISMCNFEYSAEMTSCGTWNGEVQVTRAGVATAIEFRTIDYLSRGAPGMPSDSLLVALRHPVAAEGEGQLRLEVEWELDAGAVLVSARVGGAALP
jgi:hypothetical protein